MPIPSLSPAPVAGLAVDVGDLHFNQGADSNGVEWYLTTIEGWDSPVLREDLEDRALAHGTYRSASYYGVREVTLSGSLLSPNGLGALRAAKDLLAYETDLTDVDGLLIVHETPSRQMAVRRAGQPSWRQSGQHLIAFQIELSAADPRKYGVEQRSVTLSDGQTASAPNIGMFRGGAPLQLAFTGAGTLQVGGQPVVVTDSVVIDTLEGTALVGGFTAYSRLGAGGTFPTLPPRSSTALSYSGSGSVTATWRDAWI